MASIAPAFIARAVWVWIVLGALSLAYMAFCPGRFHTTVADFIAGLLVGLAVVACFVRPPAQA